ncbi:hypothetical protein B0H16DRAFT_1428647 [Mycena metata]|uniref:F-box domain-containing protein n=1 Tax=Mycena metata TaxID=1033252 RepID=A0AAD7HVP6_9AGAR|nr:hypothetical protein B0H16DRAFT_1428647 [Mycena metata]
MQSEDVSDPSPLVPSGVVRTPQSLRRRLAEIDDETADLQVRLQRLAAERRPIVESLRSIFYPVLDLPPEVTAEIFLYCVNTAYIGNDGNLTIAPRLSTEGHGPLILASVCRAWRAIALGLRPIWSKFHLRTGLNTTSSTQKLLECWLPRTGGHPLDVSISCPAVDTLLADLAPCAHQLQTLDCSLLAPITFPGSFIEGRLPLLNKLYVSLYGDLGSPPTLVTTFAYTPSLREVHLDGVTLPWIALPWGQLTCLGLSNIGSTDCVHFLHQTLNLETLTVADIGYDDIPPLPVRLAHLQTLRFHEYQRDITLLDHLTLPALTTLELPVVEWDLTQNFLDFVARSACALRSLVITFTGANVPFDLIPYLRALPTLSELRIRAAEWGVHTLRHFLGVMAEPGFLPNLRTLSFNPFPHSIELPYADLAVFLAARWHGRSDKPGDARLESFELVLGPDLDFDPNPSIAQLQDGLDALRALEVDGPKLNIRGLHRIAGTVDAVAICPPFDHRRL